MNDLIAFDGVFVFGHDVIGPFEEGWGYLFFLDELLQVERLLGFELDALKLVIVQGYIGVLCNRIAFYNLVFVDFLASGGHRVIYPLA